jgi:hypothetical protein
VNPQQGLLLLDNRELSFDFNAQTVDLIKATTQEDPLKVSNYYKTEEVRLVTAEKKAIKIWTYEF